MTITRHEEGTALVHTPDAPLAQRAPVVFLRPLATPAELIQTQNETRTFVRAALVKDRDYGRIPGTNKDTMLKPGAERTAIGFGCHYGDPTIIEQEIDHDRDVTWRKTKAIWEGQGRSRRKVRDEVVEGKSLGLYRYVMSVPLIHNETGRIVAVGIGSCSTMESKYVDRPRDSENTIVKMAHKRAVVAACLLGFGLSDEFTQDVEDLPREQLAPEEPADRQESAQPPQPPKPAEPVKEMTLAEAQAFPFPFDKNKPASGRFGKALSTFPLKMLQDTAQWSIDNNREQKDYRFLEAVQLLVDDAEKSQAVLPFDQPASGSSASAAPAASPSPTTTTTGSAPTTTSETEYGTGPIASVMAPAVPHHGEADPTSRHAITHELQRLCNDERLPAPLRSASLAVLKNPKATLQQLTRRVEEMRARLPLATADAILDSAERELRELENLDDEIPF